MSLEELIKKKRPNISDNTLKSYVNCLKKIKSDLKIEGELKNATFLHDTDKLIEYIDNHKKITTKKNKLTCIIVGLDADKDFKNKYKTIEIYQKLLKSLNDDYNMFLSTQTKTATQRKNWIEYEELVNIANNLVNSVKKYKTRDDLNKLEMSELQNAVLLKTHLVFPIRNDLSEVKIINNIDYEKLTEKERLKHNWLLKTGKKMKLIFNNFKNAKRLGSKEYDVPRNLVNLYNIWFKFNKSDNFLVSKKDMKSKITSNNQTKYFNSIFKKDMKSKITSNNQTKYFNSIFKPYYPDKKISSSLIRHIVISYFAEKNNEPTIAEEQAKEKEVEDKYMHSSAVNKMYRKVDKDDKKEEPKEEIKEVNIIVEEKPKKKPKTKKVKKVKKAE
jgi:hypothetical protein